MGESKRRKITQDEKILKFAGLVGGSGGAAIALLLDGLNNIQSVHYHIDKVAYSQKIKTQILDLITTED
jgi:hypothetical protein